MFLGNQKHPGCYAGLRMFQHFVHPQEFVTFMSRHFAGGCVVFFASPNIFLTLGSPSEEHQQVPHLTGDGC